MEFKIDLQQEIVYLIGPDPAEPDAFVGTIRCAMLDHRYRPGFGFLRDRRGAVPPSIQYVEDVSQRLRELKDMPSTRYAIVVDTHASYGMMRLARKRTWGAWVEVELFETTAEAIVWLREARRSSSVKPPLRHGPAAEGESAR